MLPSSPCHPETAHRPTGGSAASGIDLLAMAVLRRMGRTHKLNHPLYTGERQSDVAIGGQTSVSADGAPLRGASESPA